MSGRKYGWWECPPASETKDQPLFVNLGPVGVWITDTGDDAENVRLAKETLEAGGPADPVGIPAGG